MPTLPTTVVVPTVGRPSLTVMLKAIQEGHGPLLEAVVVVDDRAAGDSLEPELKRLGLPGLRVIRCGGRGPAAARNLGWRHARTPWVSFLDDDVVPDEDWREVLATDLALAGPDVAAIQGRVRVPLPTDRRPTDWERSTAGLATARWITADMTYLRTALSAVGGFDERFPRAFREDSDLGLRVLASAGRLVTGRRWITHPVRPSDFWASLRQQAGNADDMLMRRLHGPRWRQLCGAPEGRRRRHLAVTGAALLAAGLAAFGQRRAAALAAAGWLAGTAEFAYVRVRPGPRTPAEVATMLVTSAAIPVAATYHTLRGAVIHRGATRWRGLPDLVLFDRDGTLVHDVPYNRDPELVEPVPGAWEALERLRAAGIRTGVVTNQSGIAAGTITPDELDAVNERVEKLLGPFDAWQICPHGRDDQCSCRKPAPGMVTAACQELGVDPTRCVVIGDIGSDVAAAETAGAVGILVPTSVTRCEEVASSSRVADDLGAAVDSLLAGTW